MAHGGNAGRWGDLPFTPIRAMDGGQVGREFARWVCTRCEAHADLPLVKGGKNVNPEATTQRATAAGWRVSGRRAECPSCVAASRARASGEAPNKPEPQVIHMAEAKTTATAREMTQPERLKIRAILDKHFDDGAGCWLDGYSDQKAGEEIGVPWAFVTKVREAAYGPIRVDPEIAALRAEMADLSRKVAEAMDAVQKLAGKEAEMRARLDKITAKRAA